MLTGASPHGQGEETTFAQIVADELGVPMDDVLVIHGDTAVVQYGIGTFGSRGTAVGGSALYYALQDLKAKMKKFGAMLLESEDVTFGGGAASMRPPANRSRFAEMAVAAYHAKKLPPNTEPGLVATHFWEPPNFTFPVRRAHRGDRGGSRYRRHRRSGATSAWTIAGASSTR